MSSPLSCSPSPLSFFFHAPAPTDIYTLSLHDALPICQGRLPGRVRRREARHHHLGRGGVGGARPRRGAGRVPRTPPRSEEHTSELQSLTNLVCRLLLEKKKDQPAQRAADMDSDRQWNQ